MSKNLNRGKDRNPISKKAKMQGKMSKTLNRGKDRNLDPKKAKDMKKRKHFPEEIRRFLKRKEMMGYRKAKRNKILRDEKKIYQKIEQDITDILGSNIPKDSEETQLEKFAIGGASSSDEEDEVVPQDEVKIEKKKKIPAWEDEDDETLLLKDKAKDLKNCHRSVLMRGEEKYSEYVQEKYIKLMGDPKWAELDREDKDSDDEIEDELLQKTGNFITKAETLPKGNIYVRKCPNLVDATMKSSIVKTVEFHPSSRVGLVACTNGICNLFQIDGKVNAKIQSIHFENFPIYSAHFSVDGSEIIAGSDRYSHFFSYDMLAGKINRIPWQRGMEQRNIRRFQMSPDGKYIVVNGRYGHIHLMVNKSKEWIGSLKMNGEVIAITFNRDGSRMYTHGSLGEVYVWDMSTRRCIHKFIDEGCISGTAIAISPNDQFLATGSDCGVVNIYDSESILNSTKPSPMKRIMNLTTEVTNFKFNSTSEILAAASSHKKESVKLIHFPSMSVYRNFPSKDVLSYPNSLDISINSGYLCVGNNYGTAYIYRLKHFKNY